MADNISAEKLKDKIAGKAKYDFWNLTHDCRWS